MIPTPYGVKPYLKAVLARRPLKSFEAYSPIKETTVKMQFKSLQEAQFHNPTLVNWREVPNEFN